MPADDIKSVKTYPACEEILRLFFFSVGFLPVLADLLSVVFVVFVTFQIVSWSTLELRARLAL